jgi:hypothetical protein
MTSPPTIEANACQTPILAPIAAIQTDRSRVTSEGSPVAASNPQVLIESLMNRTEPSAIVRLTPP